MGSETPISGEGASSDRSKGASYGVRPRFTVQEVRELLRALQAHAWLNPDDPDVQALYAKIDRLSESLEARVRV